MANRSDGRSARRRCLDQAIDLVEGAGHGRHGNACDLGAAIGQSRDNPDRAAHGFPAFGIARAEEADQRRARCREQMADAGIHGDGRAQPPADRQRQTDIRQGLPIAAGREQCLGQRFAQGCPQILLVGAQQHDGHPAAFLDPFGEADELLDGPAAGPRRGARRQPDIAGPRGQQRRRRRRDGGGELDLAAAVGRTAGHGLEQHHELAELMLRP